MTSHAQKIYNAGQLLATNLQAKGVEASASDGLTTLINKVLDIEASVGGIDIYTHISLVSQYNTASVGSSITLSGVLEADKDDETAVNVDLEGYLKGATVKLYNGNTLIGTAVTNADGEYSYNWTPSSTGTAVLSAIFEGTDDYEQCVSSNVNVTVLSVQTINLVTDKSILSYVDNESAVLTATCLDGSGNPVENVPVSFDIVDSSTGNVIENIGTSQSNSNGVATVTYYSKGTGDLYIRAEATGENILSTQKYIQDNKYYKHNYNITSNVNAVPIDYLFDKDEGFTFICTFSDDWGIILRTDSNYQLVSIDPEMDEINYDDDELVMEYVVDINDIFKLVKSGNSITLYINNTSVVNFTLHEFNASFKLKFTGHLLDVRLY